MPELFSQPDFQSFGFGASLDRVVSLVELWFQPEAQPLAPPFTTLPEITGSLVANLVLSKSLLRSQGGLTDVYVRVLRIESESSLIRNLNHVNAIRQFTWPRSCVKPSRSITRVDLTLAGTVNETISSKSMRLKPSATAARAASLANPRPQ